MLEKSVCYWKVGLVFCAIAGSPALPSTGNGGGVNGPDLTGISIPVEIDRTISQADMVTALGVCAKDLLNPIFVAIFKKEPEQIAMDSYDISCQKKGEIEEECYIRSMNVHASSNNSDCRLVGPALWPRNSTWHLVATGEKSCGRKVGAMELNFANINGVLPNIHYRKVLSNVIYDEFGNIVSSRELFTNVRIVSEIPSAANEPLWNASLDKPVPLAANTLAYEACLQAELTAK